MQRLRGIESWEPLRLLNNQDLSLDQYKQLAEDRGLKLRHTNAYLTKNTLKERLSAPEPEAKWFVPTPWGRNRLEWWLPRAQWVGREVLWCTGYMLVLWAVYATAETLLDKYQCRNPWYFYSLNFFCMTLKWVVQLCEMSIFNLAIQLRNFFITRQTFLTAQAFRTSS